MEELAAVAVLEFLVKHLGVKPESISLNTDIGKMHAQGDDAEEMMCQFFEHFKVDAGNFDLLRHFSPERPLLGGTIRIRDLLRGRLSKHEPLTPADLAIAVEQKRWCKY